MPEQLGATANAIGRAVSEPLAILFRETNSQLHPD